MKNADSPVMPIENYELAVAMKNDGGNLFAGLTKREMFAIHAMQGILSNSGGVIQGNSLSGTGWCNSNAQDLAKWSVECAEALLAELDKCES
tara:strand:+ start:99 stop:374 length:276 start_codon:yes stop_codon:yes gene_type:complete